MRGWVPVGIVLVVVACGDDPSQPKDNREPQVLAVISDVEIQEGEAREWTLASHFTDPDGDSLGYRAESSADESVLAYISDDSRYLVIEGRAPPGGMVTVTASDPDGASVSLGFGVTVAVPLVDQFQDDFDSDTGAWKGFVSTIRDQQIVRVGGGVMQVRITEVEGHHYAVYELGGLMGPGWEAKARLTRTDGACAALMLFPEVPVPREIPEMVVKLQWNSDDTWYLGFFRGVENTWLGLEPREIPEAQAGEYLDLMVGIADGRIYGWRGATQLFDEGLPHLGADPPIALKAVGVGGYPCGGEGLVTIDRVEARRKGI